jgi:cytochrome c-type biogenesis protein CcmF
VTLAAFGLGAFAGTAALRQLALAVRRQGVRRGLVGRTNGGMVVHVGVVLVAVAIAASNGYVEHDELTLEPGESGRFAGHTFTYEGWSERQETERLASVARVRIDGGSVWEPAVSEYLFAGMTVPTPSTRTTLTEDIQLTFREVPDGRDGAAVIGITVQPMVLWLWLGGAVMAAGTVLSMLGGRRDASIRRRRQPAAERAGAPADDVAPEPAPEPAVLG